MIPLAGNQEDCVDRGLPGPGMYGVMAKGDGGG